ncbi:MAG: Rne/Rng family ribonuclease, partial [Rhizobiaceae bacterium]
KKKDTETKAAKTEPANDESAEEAPKKKRVSRSKKTDDSEEGKASTEAASAEQDDVAEQEKKLRKRRTSRKKAVADDDAVVEVSTEETALDAKDEKPKKATRRRTSRTKVEAEEVAADTTSEEAESGSTETPAEADEEKQPRARKSRSRSRRGKKNTKTDHDDGSNDAVEQLGSDDALEEVPQRRSNRRHYKIQEVIKRRQILLVQVVKEERGNKGAALTTYLSLAGRYSVLMPNTARGGGISRKITNAADRKRLKSIASALEVPQGMGVILRTAGASRDQEEIQRDFEYLMRLWENVRTLTLDSTAPCLVYEEGSLIKRSIRDLFDTDTSEIMVAGENGFKEAKDFMNMLMPSQTKKVKLYTDRIPMFAKMGVEAQLDAMLQPQVTLKSGGYLILDQTEALVAIDVNSGRSTRQHSIEETAVQTNLEAADEVARQLRLRDLAGLIVIDFIDMEDRRNVRAVEKRLKDALKNDRARIQVGRISHFGLMEMSRQRIRASVLESTTQTCPTCEGLGHVRSPSSVVLGVLRAIEEHLNRNSRNNLTIKVSTTTAIYLLNNKRESLSDLEIRFGVSLLIETDNGLGTTPCEIEKGEFSNRKPVQSAAVQADQVMDDDEESSISSEAASSSETRNEPADQGEDQGRKKRRRRRRRRGSNSEEETERDNSTEEASTSAAGESTREQISEVATEESEAKPAKRVRRKKKSDDEVVLEENAATSEDKEEKPKRRRRKSAETRVDEVETPVKEEASTARTTDDKPKRRTTRRKISEDEQSEEIEAVSDTPVADKSSDEKKPKKGGWWQRKFF